MTPDDLKDAPESPQTGGKWVSTSAAAAVLGVSERTVLRRAVAGKLPSRKETTGRGVVMLVALESGAAGADVPTGAARGADTQNTLESAPEAREVPTGADTFTRGADTGLSAHLAEENRFLRGVIEQLQRDGAETRAALREALKSMPKALTTGTDAGESSTTDPEAGNGPRALQSGAAGTRGHTREKAPQIAPESSETGLSYGDIADWLERETP